MFYKRERFIVIMLFALVISVLIGTGLVCAGTVYDAEINGLNYQAEIIQSPFGPDECGVFRFTLDGELVCDLPYYVRGGVYDLYDVGVLVPTDHRLEWYAKTYFVMTEKQE